ncbi:MAG: hypothetical protein DRI94_10610 [Bacteroidetes bacterium]|nr:MAG: hypothetical protein DRI94_10610 [Bacteroidota bacterium]
MKKVFLFIILLIFFWACRKDVGKPRWDIDILAPILKTSISIKDIVPDSISTTDNDGLISLIYSNLLYAFTLDTAFKIPDTSLTYSAKLDNISIDDIVVTNRTSLGDIALNDQQNGSGDLYNTIMNAHNTGTPAVIDPIAQQEYTNLTVDATQYFQTVTLIDGYIDFYIDNQLPIDVTNIVIELKNQNSGTIVLQDTIPMVASHTNLTVTNSLAGKTVEGMMLGTVKIESPGSYGNQVVIDTAMAMTTTVTIRDIKIASATAIFPTQEVINQKEEASIDDNNFKLTKLKAKSGQIKIDVYNTLEQDFSFDYKMPGATLSGNELQISGNIPPANSGVPGIYTTTKDISGYDLNMQGISFVEQIYGDLNGNGFIDADTVNTFYYELIGRIDSNGNLVSISLNDSVYIVMSLQNVVPEYAEGYLGQQSFAVADTSDFEISDIFDNSAISINQAKLSLSVRNQVGVEGSVRINNLTAVNSNINSQVTLNSTITANPFIISKPTNTFDINTNVTPTTTNFELNQNNSNITDLINIYPDKIYYDIEVLTNPNNPPSATNILDDFIYYGDSVTTYINAEIPLSLIAKNLFLSDTANYNLTEEDIKNVNGGNLNLYIDNDFPIESKVQLYLLDANFNIYDSLLILQQNILPAGIIQNSIYTQQKRTKITIPVSVSKLQEIVNSSRILINVEFNTKPENIYVKIYDFYKMNFKIVADFNYSINK